MTRTEHLLTILAEECAEVAQRASKGNDILGSSAVPRDFDYFRNSDQISGKAVDSSANTCYS